MAKPRQPRRELKKTTPTQDQSTPVNPSSENDPKALVPPVVEGGTPVNPSSEGPTQDQPTQKKGSGRKKTKTPSQKPQDAPGEASSPDQGDSLPAVPEASQAVLVPLTEEQAIRREQLEYEVEQGLDTAFKVANALLTIRDEKLYQSTHATYEEYVEARFQMSVRRARQMTAAATVVKALEQAGVTELPENERQVRELNKVVPEEQKKVWETAKTEAAKKGRKPKVSDVKKAASSATRKPTQEQKKVQKKVDKGVIPEGVQVTSTTVDEGVDAAKVADIDLPDEEWLTQFPIRTELDEHCRTLFDQEALYYRWFSPHRKPLVRNVTQKLGEQVRKVAKRVGPYVTRIEKALSLADPRTWVVCKSCNGTGIIKDHGACSDCKSAGYRLG